MGDTGGTAGYRRGPKSQCKICHTSIFEADLTEWVRVLTPGLAHRSCADAFAERMRGEESG